MGDSLADVCLVRFIGQGTGGFPYGVETVGGIITVVDGTFYLANMARLASVVHLDEYHFALEIVEYDDVLIQDVEDIGCIVLGFGAVFHLHWFEIAHGVERGISIHAAIVGIFSFYPEAGKEAVHHILHRTCFADRSFFARVVGIDSGSYIVAYADTGYRVQPDERTVVFAPVIVGAFHQGALRKEVAHLQVGADRCMQVAQQHFMIGMVMVGHFLVNN